MFTYRVYLIAITCIILQEFHLNKVIVREATPVAQEEVDAHHRSPRQVKEKTYNLDPSDKFWVAHKGRYSTAVCNVTLVGIGCGVHKELTRVIYNTYNVLIFLFHKCALDMSFCNR